MIAVIFEVIPADAEAYVALAAELAPRLQEIDGFISVERFESLGQPGKVLSLSFWRDEPAARAWRNTAEHRRAQSLGRAGVLRDYRLRVDEVLRDYGLEARDEAPSDSRRAHD